jgi:hypothetical protein
MSRTSMLDTSWACTLEATGAARASERGNRFEWRDRGKYRWWGDNVERIFFVILRE